MRLLERKRQHRHRKEIKPVLRAFIRLLIFLYPFYSTAQQKDNSIEIYGFINSDAGYNVNTINPDWYDVMRPTKLPSYKGEFAPSGSTYFSVRQTRLGVRSSTSTPLGILTTRFEFD